MESLQSIFMSFFNVIPAVVEAGICMYYLIKSRSTDAVLLAVGSGTHVLTAIAYSIVMPILLRDMGYTKLASVYTIVGIFGFIGTVAFLIGLFLLIQKRLAQQEPSQPW
jgi:Na+/melibiose symporter-like transporter